MSRPPEPSFPALSSSISSTPSTSTSTTQSMSEMSQLTSSLGTIQYSASQLASLSSPYYFQWTSAAYFVTVCSGILLSSLLLALLYYLTQLWIDRRRGNVQLSLGESYLVDGNHVSARPRARPSSQIIDALKGRKISSPMPSDHSNSTRLTCQRSGGTERTSDSDGGNYTLEHGW